MDENDNTYLEATMPKMVNEIETKFKDTMGREAKAAPTPG